MEKLLKLLVTLLPLIFAFGFLTPVMAEAMRALGVGAPFGLSTLPFAAIVCGTWGLVAQARGRWI